MRAVKNIRQLVLFVLIIFSAVACEQNIQTYNDTLWYEYPGKYWNSQGLHLGSGYFGASFFGGEVIRSI